ERLEGVQVQILNLGRRGLENDLELKMTVDPERILAVATVHRASGGRAIGGPPGLRTEHPEESIRMHGPRADLDVVRLLEHGALSAPVLGEGQDQLLERHEPTPSATARKRLVLNPSPANSESAMVVIRPTRRRSGAEKREAMRSAGWRRSTSSTNARASPGSARSPGAGRARHLRHRSCPLDAWNTPPLSPSFSPPALHTVGSASSPCSRSVQISKYRRAMGMGSPDLSPLSSDTRSR